MADKKNNNNNNFFNQNPLLLFIIFAILIVLIFRSIAPNAVNEVNNLSQSQVVTFTYSDIKRLAKEGKLAYVAIGRTTIKAKLKDGEIITVPKVPNDPTLVETLDKYHVPYGAIKIQTG